MPHTTTSAFEIAVRSPAPSGAYCILLEVSLNAGQTVYLTNNDAAVSYGGNSYQPWPLTWSGFSQSGNENPDEMTIVLPDPQMLIAQRLHASNGLQGRTVIVRVHGTAGNTTWEWGVSYKIKKPVYSPASGDVTITLGLDDVANLTVPNRPVTNDHCPARFGGDDCGYSGADTSCDYTLTGANGCRKKGNSARYYAFPGIPFEETGNSLS